MYVTHIKWKTQKCLVVTYDICFQLKANPLARQVTLNAHNFDLYYFNTYLLAYSLEEAGTVIFIFGNVVITVWSYFIDQLPMLSRNY